MMMSNPLSGPGYPLFSSTGVTGTRQKPTFGA
jgi:hypothetical protein